MDIKECIDLTIASTHDVFQIKKSGILISILQELLDEESGLKYYWSFVLDAAIESKLYGLKISENHIKFLRDRKNIKSKNPIFLQCKKKALPFLYNEAHEAPEYVLPCFCIVGHRSAHEKYCSIIWVADRIRDQHVASYLCEYLNINRVSHILRESAPFWKKYFRNRSSKILSDLICGKIMYSNNQIKMRRGFMKWKLYTTSQNSTAASSEATSSEATSSEFAKKRPTLSYPGFLKRIRKEYLKKKL
jgi:hypothetical protein